MKVLALTADKEGGVWFYRMAEPARVTSRLGVDITVDDGVDADVTIDEKTGFATVHEVMTDADLLIIQRPVKQIWHSFIQQAKRQGIATIVELDDDYDSIHRKNAAYNVPSLKEAQNTAWVRACAEIADHVTVSTPALTKFGSKGRTSILRNCVPEDYFAIKPAEELPCTTIGWSGSVSTHPTDLQVTKGAVAEVLRKNDAVLGVVGDGEDVKTNLGLLWNHPDRITGWVPRAEYMQAMADNFNIGIVPLELSPFNEGKSNLKGLEMAALGIPFVASPTREYQRLAAYGVGKLASSPGGWRKELQRMIDRPEETLKLSKQYRETLYNEGMTYESSAHEWVTAWEQAVAYRKSHHG